MKRVLSLGLVMTIMICALLTFMPVTAETYGDLSYENCGDHIEITDCSESAVSVDIPAKIDNLPVTVIGDESFSFCGNLISVNMPDSVTRIGDRAFYYCSSLTSVKIPDKVTSIGNNAFSGCGRVNIDASSQNNVYSSIDGVLFNKAKTQIFVYAKDVIQPDYTIPNNVTSIGDSAFDECKSLKSINIPNSVTSIGDSAFEYCESLTNIDIPNSVTSISDYTFFGCSSLKNINLPSSITNIGDSAFRYCRSLTNINIPDSVTSMGNSAFACV